MVTYGAAQEIAQIAPRKFPGTEQPRSRRRSAARAPLSVGGRPCSPGCRRDANVARRRGKGRTRCTAGTRSRCSSQAVVADLHDRTAGHRPPTVCLLAAPCAHQSQSICEGTLTPSPLNRRSRGWFGHLSRHTVESAVNSKELFPHSPSVSSSSRAPVHDWYLDELWSKVARAVTEGRADAARAAELHRLMTKLLRG